QMYTWKKPFYALTQEDYDWNNVYAALYEINTIAEGVMDSKNGAMAIKQGILGEALVHRAFSYFILVNEYAKQYDEKTAASDPGVPLVLQAKLFTNLKRATVKQVYDQILADIKTAIPLLPLTQDNVVKPTKAAAYALLSKTYLYMRSFGNAAAFADSALAIKNTLADYNAYVATSTYTFPTQYADKEIILRKGPRTTYGAVQLSAGLLSLLGTNDIRYKLFVGAGSKFYPQFTGFGFYPRDRYNSGDKSAVGLTVPDTWLIKAECLARAGDKDGAIKMVNDLRKLRFSAADYADLSATDAADALRIVIEERRREFFGRGMRWFDQRRLNLDPAFAKPVTRVFDGQTYTLQPGSNAYIFPIAPSLIAKNPEIEQNPD
ncbi:MAG: RagB/SusD family nutrient uptake outer membrane protein, partial [Bacteroidetes bacterium]|nr:RagB/SusD family nutrient uptake outer membrane protein [Bacteroidota bacterium]